MFLFLFVCFKYMEAGSVRCQETKKLTSNYKLQDNKEKLYFPHFLEFLELCHLTRCRPRNFKNEVLL